MIKQILALLGLATVSSCTQPYMPSKSLSEAKRPDTPFHLIIYSDYGSKTTVKIDNPSEADVLGWIDKLDWNEFHQVILEHDENNCFEVGGSLNPTDGLSSMARLGADDYVIAEAPTTIDQLKALIISYHKNDDKWKQVYE